MSFTITSTDPSTGEITKYTRKTASDALGMITLLVEKGFSAEITEGPVRAKKPRQNPRVSRQNPGELLILSGFVANPKKKPKGATEELEEVEDAFRDFHAGADPDSILEMPDDAAPPGTPKELFALGELVSLVYEVPPNSGKAPGAPFRHFLGEVGHSTKVVKRHRPLLCGTADGKYLVIVHRNKPGSSKTYKVRPEGIVG